MAKRCQSIVAAMMLAFAVACGSTSDGTPMGPVVIAGQVVDDNGQPLADARVYFTNGPSPLPDIAALTDEGGQFSLTLMQAGEYTIVCSADGYKDDTIEFAVGPSQAPVTPLQFRMIPR